ncbi:DUF4388 domain-containing protein [candidate division WOR-3 bacterium]|nr:DUF4388 domain-containing protein [candidate division WOR-3 bacterium]
MAALSGKLTDFEIPTILQFIKMSNKNGILKISSAKTNGEIHFKDSSIVYAIDGDENSGEVALFNLFQLKDGAFEFVPSENILNSHFDLPIDNAYQSLQSQLKEWEEITRAIPDLNLSVGLISDPAVKEVKITPPQWIIAAQVDNLKSLKDLSASTGFSQLETAKIVYSLIQNGLVEVSKKTVKEDSSSEIPRMEDQVDEDFEEEDDEEAKPIGKETDEERSRRISRRKHKKGFFR